MRLIKLGRSPHHVWYHFLSGDPELYMVGKVES